MDGPFAETKEQIGGFFDTKPDLDTAIAYGDILASEYGSIEVRPVGAFIADIGAVFREEWGRAVHPHQRPRRLRPRRGRCAGRLHDGPGALAGGRHAAQSRSLDRHDGAQSGDRPDQARADARTQDRAPRKARGAPRRGRGGHEHDPRRAARARLHQAATPRWRRKRCRTDRPRGRRPRDGDRAGSSHLETTMAQRLVRASARSARQASRSACLPTRSSPRPARTVLAVLYLVFNEGYDGDFFGRRSRPARALRRGNPARQAARASTPDGRGARTACAHAVPRLAPEARTTGDDLVLLEDQDRTLWDESRIEEGTLRPTARRAWHASARTSSRRRLRPFMRKARPIKPAVAALYERLAIRPRRSSTSTRPWR